MSSSLISLSSELSDLIFEYLSQLDIIKIFSQINDDRLNALICRYMNTIDFSVVDKRWITKYLSIIKSFIITIRFNHKQLDELFSLYSTIKSIRDTYPQLKSVLWLDVSENQNEKEKYAQYLNVFKQICTSLTLHCNKHWNDQELINQIFRDNQSILELLTYTGDYCLAFKPVDLHPNYSLRRLTLSLSCLSHLFLLVEYLSQL
ncbi:unnamed protein product [Didymodactylos carnosus]|uniref:Uncharacterized protein n=1 Tax=Didymodactylos carnosus TaxID=1234261 RepID=A0A8S2RLD5_9BILA|nr:unnamed protein product [Didymodactylos carnosus]CAF4168571.1 unnamed protein product [Didymodactylos carnosus]